MEGAAERLLRGDGVIAKPGQPAQHQVDLHLGAAGQFGCRLAEQPRQHGRADIGQDEPGLQAVFGRVARRAPVAHLAVGGDRRNLRPGDDLGAVPASGRLQCAGDCSHSTDRNVPLAGAAAEQVVEQADVLGQRRVAESGERSDQRIGGHHPADQIAADRLGDGQPDRLLDQRRPRRRGVGAAGLQHLPAGVLAAAQRFGQRRPQRFGHRPATPVEVGETTLVAGGAHRRERRSRRSGGRSIGVGTDQQSGAATVARVRRVGGIAAPGQPDRSAEILDDAGRQQAHQIGVSGQPGIDPVERPRRHRRPAHLVESFQHPDPKTGPGQIAGRHQSVVPAADDDDIQRIGGGTGHDRSLDSAAPRPGRITPPPVTVVR